MRLLVDEHGLAWDEAWAITRGTFSYTNHTLMPEALETWPVAADRAAAAAPPADHLRDQRRFLDELRAAGPTIGDPLLADVSLIDESWRPAGAHGPPGLPGRHKVNGVSALHGELMKQTVFADLPGCFPDRITDNHQRRHAAPLAARGQSRASPSLITETHRAAGAGSPTSSGSSDLRPRPSDPGFRHASPRSSGATRSGWRPSSRSGTGSALDPTALFDVQIKRIHEYKRQLLNMLQRSRPTPTSSTAPADRLRRPGSIFAGKAAPAYALAKLIIKLINDVARWSTPTRWSATG